MIFQNREEAGQLLAKQLEPYKKENTLVLSLPRGGTPVGAEIAKQLKLPLDVLIVRKIGAPHRKELGVGAVCEDSDPLLNTETMQILGLTKQDLEGVILAERKKIQQQTNLFRDGKELSNLKNKTIILVDDGLATGSTMRAAIQYLKQKEIDSLIVAVPVGAKDTAQEVSSQVDDIIILEQKEDLQYIAKWYQNFAQVNDNKVINLLRKYRKLEFRPDDYTHHVGVDASGTLLEGELTIFPEMKAIIVFAHGSGSSRKSPRNQQVAKILQASGFGTLLFDLLTEQEAKNRSNIFDIELLAGRLMAATKWLRQQPFDKEVSIGFFGASTGAAAALIAAARLPKSDSIFSIVSRGGRPDLVGDALDNLKAPTLLLVGSKDESVLGLNKNAAARLKNSKLKIIPNATHLFEEPGALEVVSQQSADWFEQHLPEKYLSQLNPPEEVSAKGKSQPEAIEQAIAEHLTVIEDENSWDQLIQSIKDKRVVMLGESTHGTEEFYQIRSEISKRLIEDHGFKFIAVEGDWPDAYRLNQYITKNLGESAAAVLMENHRWPTWMWANEEIVKLAEWLKTKQANFYGLDVYSLFDSIDEVLQYMKEKHPNLSKNVEELYSCFSPFERDEIAYARSLIKYPPGCREAVAENLQTILKLRVNNLNNEENLFNSQQNARVIANAENYYRTMIDGDEKSWNVRDSHMMETLDQLLEKSEEGAKAIVWAHNTHIGDYRATDMKDKGYINIGGLARENYGDENVALIGFGSYEGTVLAGRAWGAPEKVMPLPPAHKESYEHYFHQVIRKTHNNEAYILLDYSSHPSLSKKRGHRAVGVVYDPYHELKRNYVPTNLLQRYNAFIFVNQSTALKSLHAAATEGKLPETWPVGF